MKDRLKRLFALSLILLTLSGCYIPGITPPDDEDDYFYTKTATSEKQIVSDATIQYTWILYPKINATNIITFDGSQIDPSQKVNDSYKKYSIILSDGKYGFIDYRGVKVVPPSYDHFYFCTCGEMVLYNSDSDGNRSYCTLDKKGKVKYSVSKHENNLATYYWDPDTEQAYVKLAGNSYLTKYDDNKPIVALSTEVTSIGHDIYAAAQQSDPKYGIIKNNRIKLDFDYDDYYTPAFNTNDKSVFALKKAGKWGYFTAKGKKFISMACNHILSSDCGEIIDPTSKSHPYLFSDGYLSAANDSGCCYYDQKGNCVIPVSEFEQARPVHNGRAWVKQNGYWGVVQIGKILEEESSNLGFKKNTTSYSAKFTKNDSNSKDDSSLSSKKVSKKASNTAKNKTTRKTAKTTAKSVTTKAKQTQSPQTNASQPTKPATSATSAQTSAATSAVTSKSVTETNPIQTSVTNAPTEVIDGE